MNRSAENPIHANYDLDKIKFATDRPTLERAIGLYESGKVRNFKAEGPGFSAVVLGTSPYSVYVSAKKYNAGTCSCYLGQSGALCKHMVAVALWAVMNGKPLTKADKQVASGPTCSGHVGSLTETGMKELKAEISAAVRYIKPYEGPSRIWFAYQDSLMEGCNRLSAIISTLPVSKQTARLLIDLLLRLDKKLSVGGVDDSDGTVGGFIEGVVNVLEEYAQLDPACIKTFQALQDRDTCFGWEESLVKIHQRQKS